MRIRHVVALLALWVVSLWMIAPAAAFGRDFTYMLGSTPVVLHEYAAGGRGGFTFFAPHSNETTAVAAAKSVVRKSGGDVFWLTHGDGARNISFTVGGKRYTVDPNRIFSDAGAKASLTPYSPEAFAAVRGLAKSVLGEILYKNSWPIIGIHNNTDGGGKKNLSVIAYGHGGDFAAAASKVYAAPKRDPDDFFFVTTGGAFAVLQKKGFNVVLQSRSAADDGSLSILCEHMNVPYINVEAQAGHLSQQIEMLRAATGT